MKKLACKLAVFVLTGLVGASAQDSSARVEGIVVEVGSGIPVADATVELTPAGSTASGRLRTTTDESGWFAVEGIAPGLYELGVDGELLVRAPSDGAPSAVRLGAGDELSDLRIQMLPTAVISGRVLDAEGNPQRGIIVGPRTYQYGPDGGRQLGAVTPLQRGQSDDRGQFRIFGLAPGTYHLEARSGPAGGDISLYRPVYYPGTYNEDQSIGIAVAAGTEAGGIDITLPSPDEEAAGTIYFRVSGAFPPPARVVGAIVRRGVPGSRRPAMVQAVGGGVFSISPPTVGDYDVFAQVVEDRTADREVPVRHSSRLQVNLGPDDLDLGTIPLIPAVQIAGRLRFDPTPPPSLDDFTFGLVPASTEATVPFASTADTEDDGEAFTISNVPRGRYDVRLPALPPLYYLAAATYGPENVLGREVIVTGDTQARLELTFASGAATAGGVVRGPDGEPVSGATVALLPIPGNRQDRYLYKTTISDQLGRFSIDGITPGEYDIYAWEHVPENAYRNAGFMAGFTNRGERVRLERNSGTDLDLDLIPQD